jgi:hypothetical protein
MSISSTFTFNHYEFKCTKLWHYEEWSIEFNMGLNKPYNTMTPGYQTPTLVSIILI